MPLDVAAGCLVLGQFAEEAAGPDDRYPGASDDELGGAICAWDRIEAYASSRKHGAVAELIRRRPAEGYAPAGPARMPEAVDEFATRELASVLGETRTAAGDMVSLAQEIELNLPGTKAAFRAGIVSQRKAAIIASATAQLDPAEARTAEDKVLDRAGTLTPPALRAAIQRAVMEVAPNKAKQRREHEAKKTRVERWAEGSGNAGLAGRELPAAQVLAAGQRVTAWAKELRKAGVEGGLDALRARTYLDILLGMDSRPLGSRTDGTGESQAPAPGPAGPLAGVIPPGFAGQRYLSEPALREHITAVTNRTESFHNYATWLMIGGRLIGHNDPDYQERVVKFNELIANAAIYSTALDITDAANTLAAEGHPVDTGDLATITPYITRTIRRFGDWVLDLKPPDGSPATRLDLQPRVLSPTSTA
jgi:hypothetical protein